LVTYLAVLRPGRTVGDLAKLGYQATAGVDGYDPHLVVVRRLSSAGLGPADLDALRRSDILSAVQPLLSRSADPAFASCDLRVPDNRRAAAVVDQAVGALERGGSLSAEQVAATSTTFMVSDDPFDADRLIVTVNVAGPVIRLDAQGRAIGSLAPRAAIVERATGLVVAAGSAHWYG
jgi:hypothetical protein